MPTELESAINEFIEVYHKYSLVKGNYHSLYREDFRKLLENECHSLTKIKSADAWFKDLDINSDEAINFQEFLIFMVKMGVQAHKDSHTD